MQKSYSRPTDNLSMFNAVEKTLKNLSPFKKVLYFEGKIITASALNDLINKFSYKLNQLGIKKGDVITMNLPNMVNAVVVFYAANKLGAIVNSLHPLIPPEYLINSANLTNSKLIATLDNYYVKGQEAFKGFDKHVLICKISDHLPLVKKLIYKRSEKENSKLLNGTNLYSDTLKLKNYHMVDGAFNNIAVYLHSGGTTGDSKIIKLSNSAFLSLKASLIQVIPNHDPYHHCGLMVLPIFHGFGLGVCMHSMLESGFEVVLIPKFNAEKVAKVTKKENITIFAGVPVMYLKLLQLKNSHFAMLKDVEHLFCGGDKLSDNLKADFDKRLQQIGSESEILEGYGLTECVTVCSVNKANDFYRDSMGFPLKDIKLAIINEDKKCLDAYEKGEICIGGPTLMDGYLCNDEDVFIQLNGDKYIRSGDYGYLDKRGRIYFVDRIKRIVKISGITVFPSEIEKCANSVSEVLDSFAVCDDNNQIVLHVATNTIDKELLKFNILKACKKALISYAVPKTIVFYDKLPRTIVGKIKIN